MGLKEAIEEMEALSDTYYNGDEAWMKERSLGISRSLGILRKHLKGGALVNVKGGGFHDCCLFVWRNGTCEKTNNPCPGLGKEGCPAYIVEDS